MGVRAFKVKFEVDKVVLAETPQDAAAVAEDLSKKLPGFWEKAYLTVRQVQDSE